MKHYFSDNTDLKHEYRELVYKFNDITFKFVSDSGVFSKNEIDFGSELLLRNLKDISGKVLDLGCGYGVISIICKKIFNVEVTGVDINPRAIKLSNDNCKLNNLSIEYFLSDGFSNINSTFDTIISNPPIRVGKKVIYKMFEDSYKFLNKNGSLIIVIRKQQGAQSAANKINEIFNNYEILDKEKGFWIIRAIKY